jgi:hypothetical protein
MVHIHDVKYTTVTNPSAAQAHARPSLLLRRLPLDSAPVHSVALLLRYTLLPLLRSPTENRPINNPLWKKGTKKIAEQQRTMSSPFV